MTTVSVLIAEDEANVRRALSDLIDSEEGLELAGKLELEEGSKELRRAQVERIRAALEPGVLSVVFQPIVELENGAVIGYEALARFGAVPSRPPNLWFADAGAVGLQVELEL